jgi:hypothetical protein
MTRLPLAVQQLLAEMGLNNHLQAQEAVSRFSHVPPDVVKKGLARKMTPYLEEVISFEEVKLVEMKRYSVPEYPSIIGEDDRITYRAEAIVFSPEQFTEFLSRLVGQDLSEDHIMTDWEPKDVTKHDAKRGQLCACPRCREGGFDLQMVFYPPFQPVLPIGPETLIPDPEERVPIHKVTFELNKFWTGYRRDYVYRRTLAPNQHIPTWLRDKLLKDYGPQIFNGRGGY